MEALPGIWSLSPIAALVGVIVLLFWMLATGRLYTKSSHDEIVEPWKSSSQKWETVASEQSKQIGNMANTLGIIDDFFKKTSVRRGTEEES